MSNPKYVFNGPVGQVIEGGDLKSVSTKITMGPDGAMVVETDVVPAEDHDQEEE